VSRPREYRAISNPKAEPTRPGEILRQDVLPALNMSVAETAESLNISRQTLRRILAGTMSVSSEMAVRLGKFCGNGPELWLRMQAAYDL
jgi:antitoxin HigA-1